MLCCRFNRLCVSQGERLATKLKIWVVYLKTDQREQFSSAMEKCTS